MPKVTADCVVVGAGVIGLTTALYLARTGRRVTVIERDSAPRQASWAGAGILSPLIPWNYPPAVQQLALASQRAYPALISEVEGLSGRSVERLPLGMLLLGPGNVETGLAWANSHGVRVQVLSGDEVVQLLTDRAGADNPAVTASMKTGVQALWLPDVAGLRSPEWLDALVAALRRLGVDIRFSESARTVEIKNNKINAIKTESANVFCSEAVLCAGAWSADLLPPEQIIPMRPVRGQILLFEAGEKAPPVILQHGGQYLVPRADGRVLCGSTMEEAGFANDTTQAAARALRQAAVEMWPPLADVTVTHHWSGLRPACADDLPCIGPVTGTQGLYLNTGHYRAGIVCAPESGRLLAECMNGACRIPATLLPERFAKTA